MHGDTTTCVQALPGNRAALSLLGHCYYHQGQFEAACQAYELLARYHPHHSQYRLYHAQCLFKGGQLAEALRVLDVIEGHQQHVEQLRMAITYASEQYVECRHMLRSWAADTAEATQNDGCMLYHEGKFRCVRQLQKCIEDFAKAQHSTCPTRQWRGPDKGSVLWCAGP